MQAYNKAGLSTTITSWAFVVESSPPVAGHVFDGEKSGTSEQRDLDFQTHLNYISAYWEGFYDPQSTIKGYYISVGTCPLCQNILQHQPVGIVNGKFEIYVIHKLNQQWFLSHFHKMTKKLGHELSKTVINLT